MQLKETKVMHVTHAAQKHTTIKQAMQLKLKLKTQCNTTHVRAEPRPWTCEHHTNRCLSISSTYPGQLKATHPIYVSHETSLAVQNRCSTLLEWMDIFFQKM